MSQITDYYLHAELSLAAYAYLAMGTPSEPALIEAGMSISQAADFASKWTVVEQFNGSLSVSATIFQNNATGQRHLAIQGTQGLGDFIADAIIIDGVPSTLNPQYTALKAQLA